MKTKPLLLFILFLLIKLFTVNVHSQSIRLFTVNNELSSSLINQIYQDKKEIIWIATENGLNKYDGSKFVIYKHDKDIPNSILNNYVRVIYECTSGIFIGYFNGLQVYNRGTDKFIEIPMHLLGGSSIKPHVTSIVEKDNGDILIGTAGHGLFIYDPQKKQAHQLKLSINAYFINTLFVDREKNLWISTKDKGLLCINTKNRCNQYFIKEQKTNNITCITQDNNNTVYAGSLAKGLFVYNNKTKTFAHIPMSSHLSIKSLVAKDEKILIGTDGDGMKIFDIKRRKITEADYNTSTSNFHKFKIHSIAIDKKDNLWLGIYQKGVMLLPIKINQFNYIGNKSSTSNFIGSNCVMSICKDSQGVLWIGTDNDGIYGIDLIKKKHVHYNSANSNVPSTIMCIFEDSEKNLWIGSYTQGMAKLDKNTGNCHYITNPSNNEIDNIKSVYSFAEDSEKNLWIGTMGSDLYCMNILSGKITSYHSGSGTKYREDSNILHNGWINCLLYTKSNQLYIGTYDGMGCFDLNKKSFTTAYKKNRILSGNVIYSLYEDKVGNIWAGTSEGLICINPETHKETYYTTKNGLTSNTIYGIQGDKLNNLWISTSFGISRLTQRSKQFQNYYANDGLQGNEFSRSATCADKNGHIYFGGIDGITSFDPQKITNPVKALNLRITDFYIHDKAVREGDLSGSYNIINTNVMEADKFHLCHKDNSFSIEFSTTEFDNPERITYMYSMNNENWVTLHPGINRVSFSNLSPGTYHFKVKAKDYNTYSNIKEILIKIDPVWYASMVAKLIYFILFVLSIYIIIEQIRQRQQIRNEMQKHIHAEQINEAKLQFFINISHEIRTPMTLILSPLQKLISTDKNGERQLTYNTIYRNAERILRLVNQLMDIRKIDKGQLVLKFEEVNIVSFVKDLLSTFEYEAKIKQIEIKFNPQTENISGWIDPKNFDKVVLNLLSNAFKFTSEKGEIDIWIQKGENVNALKSERKKYIEIIISDNGISIPEDETSRIFERFYQINNNLNNSNVGTGIGLHLTHSLVELHHGNIRVENNKDEKGCRFIIQIPSGREHLKTEEIQTEATNKKRHIATAIPFYQDEKVENKTRKSKNRILVVEDDEEIRKYICNELSGEYHIIESSNGKEALNIALTKIPDLIISDIMMPEMDGLSLCHKVKQNITTNHIPVILLTAKANENDQLEGLENGADAYIVKPFNIAILQRNVKNIIANREILKNNFNGRQQQEKNIKKISLKSPDDKLLEKIVNVINNNLSNPNLNVDMITTEVGISRVHLYRKLKELTNQTTQNFIRNIRLKQAATLLAKKHHNISEVAAIVGFNNIAHFSSTFKELYGVSPTEYMENHFRSEKEEEKE
nr:two-component regulator propeller domain-containing protein [uncultured Bacteroides sp.]